MTGAESGMGALLLAAGALQLRPYRNTGAVQFAKCSPMQRAYSLGEGRGGEANQYRETRAIASLGAIRYAT